MSIFMYIFFYYNFRLKLDRRISQRPTLKLALFDYFFKEKTCVCVWCDIVLTTSADVFSVFLAHFLFKLYIVFFLVAIIYWYFVWNLRDRKYCIMYECDQCTIQMKKTTTEYAPHR